VKVRKETAERRGTPARVSAPRLTARVFGSPMFSVDGTPLHLSSRKARALLAYLVLGDSGPQARERLVGLLWSEVSEENARASLRQIVHELRQAFKPSGFEGMHADKQTISLDPTLVVADVTAITAASDAGMAHPALVEVAQLPQTLLEGLDTVDPGFSVWLRAKRQTLHERMVRGLEVGLRTVADSAIRESIANALIHLDSTHEEACRALIQARADRGDFGGALRLYKGLWDLLDEEFDVEPSIETQDLVVRIRNSMSAADQAAAFRSVPEAEVPGTADHAPAPPPVPVPPIGLAKAKPVQRNLIITVGGFDASGTAPDQRYVVHGFRHELVAGLVRFREWNIRDDMSVGQDNSPPEDVAGEYRVDATAVSGPDSVRMILTLRDAQTGVYIWSDRYSLTLQGWHDAQQSIIRKIAVTLKVHLSASRLNRLSNEPDISLDVFDRWLRAQAMIHSFDPREWVRADEIFRATIVEAPNFSPAYSSLAQMHNARHIFLPGAKNDLESGAESLQLARAAVQLDPLDSRAHLCLGWAYAIARNFSNAELHMGLAAELNDNDPWTLISTALFYSFCSHHDRAAANCKRALEVAGTPTRTHWVYQSTIEFLRGDYDGCITSSLNSGDAVASNIAWRAAAQAHIGREHDATRTLRRFYEIARTQWRDGKPSEHDLLRWMLHLYPIRDEDLWSRLRDGISRAGADIRTIEFEGR
jgi:DNA-binding SARP family transcriptional activator/TolB-like protein